MKKLLSMFFVVLFLATTTSAQKTPDKKMESLTLPGNPSHPFWAAMPIFPDPVRVQYVNPYINKIETSEHLFRGAGMIFSPPTSNNMLVVWIRTSIGLSPVVCKTAYGFQGFPENFFSASNSNPVIVPVGAETFAGSQTVSYFALL